MAAISAAKRENLTLLVAENSGGYFGVEHRKGSHPRSQPRVRPYHARVRRGGKVVGLGYFATAEEAALCVARTPQGQAAAAARPPLTCVARTPEGQAAAAARPPLTSDDALEQAKTEKLTLLVAAGAGGYFGVRLVKNRRRRPYNARAWRGGKMVGLGFFATAEEAALCVARTPEGRKTAARRAAQRPLSRTTSSN